MSWRCDKLTIELRGGGKLFDEIGQHQHNLAHNSVMSLLAVEMVGAVIVDWINICFYQRNILTNFMIK